MSTYLRTYGLEKTLTDFVLSFDIPVNCDYAVSTDSNDLNVVTVTLQSGETSPSPDFQTHTENFESKDEVLQVGFELPDQQLASVGKKVVKPRFRVDDLISL
ncbi:hypothetical protein GV828_03320 [Flavobacterium sp. NST-5]|uniref:Uncharacterized protein n=1 Tax=Flavobacterium ichthyis TaxID=2698827 RepID=A0ABW9ZBS8_9FLAO|nr:hypothetical protein [Flavobacterium ichthyis]NBL64228.1 hypothetical protein [Flavobacterium ichthyis]